MKFSLNSSNPSNPAGIISSTVSFNIWSYTGLNTALITSDCNTNSTISKTINTFWLLINSSFSKLKSSVKSRIAFNEVNSFACSNSTTFNTTFSANSLSFANDTLAKSSSVTVISANAKAPINKSFPRPSIRFMSSTILAICFTSAYKLSKLNWSSNESGSTEPSIIPEMFSANSGKAGLIISTTISAISISANKSSCNSSLPSSTSTKNAKSSGTKPLA